GVGITLQDSAPLYLMDGEHQIMISEALNESDRLSSCNKRARKVMEPQAGPFHVYAFQAAELDEEGNPEDVILSYNLGGIRMNEAAFKKLQQEITLEPLKVRLPTSLASSDKGEYRLLTAKAAKNIREERKEKQKLRDFLCGLRGFSLRSLRLESLDAPARTITNS